MPIKFPTKWKFSNSWSEMFIKRQLKQDNTITKELTSACKHACKASEPA